MAEISSSAATNAAMKIEIDNAVKKLTSLLKEFNKKDLQNMLKPGAKILIKEAQNNIPESDETHYRYSTAKVFNKIKAPKGSGNVVAVYEPGNLKRSIRQLLFKKSSAVFVGPRLAKGTGGGGTFSGAKVDGYYAHWMEYGTDKFGGVGYMRRAVDSTANDIIKSISGAVNQAVKKWENKNSVI